MPGSRSHRVRLQSSCQLKDTKQYGPYHPTLSPLCSENKAEKRFTTFNSFLIQCESYAPGGCSGALRMLSSVILESSTDSHGPPLPLSRVSSLSITSGVKPKTYLYSFPILACGQVTTCTAGQWAGYTHRWSAGS